MRSHWRRGLILGVMGLACVTVGGSPTFAHWFSGRGGYAATEYVAVAPTAYFVPTSYLLPTTYVTTGYAVEAVETVYATAYTIPTYAATSYVVPTTSYVATAARFPSWYETAYDLLPTSITVASDPCGSAVVDPCATVASTSVQAPVIVSQDATTPSIASSQPPVYSETPQAAPKRVPDPVPSTVSPPPTLESIPDEQPGSPATKQGGGGEAEPTTKRDTAQPKANGGVQPAPVDSGVPSPPVAPVPEREPAQPLSQPAPITPIEPETSGQPPVAPGGEASPIELPKVQDLGANEIREVRRPVMPAMSRSGIAQPYRRDGRARGVLEGKVVSSDSGIPEAGVKVTLSNRARTFVDRVVTTDPSGHYAVRLPDGDWTVKVAMPSGKVYAVSQLTVSDGQISDDLGRDVPTLHITR